jgi:hypothetical protein
MKKTGPIPGCAGMTQSCGDREDKREKRKRKVENREWKSLTRGRGELQAGVMPCAAADMGSAVLYHCEEKSTQEDRAAFL